MKRVLLSGIYGPDANDVERYFDFGQRPKNYLFCNRTKRDILRSVSFNSNTGNYLIGEGAREALRGSDVTYLPAWYISEIINDSGRIAEVREHFDYFVFGTANMLRREYSACAEAEIVEKLNMPTVFLGMGVQRNEDLASLPEMTMRLLEWLSSNGGIVFTRGIPTAEYLFSLGIENVFATGCPSLYFNPDGIRDSLYRLGRIRDIEFESIVTGGYLGRDRGSIADVNFLSEICKNISYVIQDETHFYSMSINSNDGDVIYDDWNGKLDAKLNFIEDNKVNIPNSFHVFFDPERWRVWVRQHDIYIGRRFHGGVVSMQAGLPSLFLSEDDRMREMLEVVKFPYIETSEWFSSVDRRNTLRNFLERLDISSSIIEYNKKASFFKGKLSDLGLRN